MANLMGNNNLIKTFLLQFLQFNNCLIMVSYLTNHLPRWCFLNLKLNKLLSKKFLINNNNNNMYISSKDLIINKAIGIKRLNLLFKHLNKYRITSLNHISNRIHHLLWIRPKCIPHNPFNHNSMHSLNNWM